MIVFATIIAGQNYLNSQSVTFKETLDSINIMLKANPYFDGFNEIAFYYSVNITTEKELVVEMSFNGPFIWVYKVKISDLDISPKKDICRESPGSLCWNCIKTDSAQVNSFVQAEMRFTDGSSEKQNSSSICVSFSRQSMICSELNKKFQFLFSKVMNDSR